jgi:hypothetical protein
VATENIRAGFRRWRRGRPFWGGLLLVLSGLEMLGSANLELDDIRIHIGPQGFFSYLLPVMLITAGALVWFSPAQRLFYGVVAILTALYSFIGLNLGGWIAGMTLGIVGGALVVAWGPPARSATGPVDGQPAREIAPDGRDTTALPHRKTLIILAPLLLAATVTAAGHRPAEAAESAGAPGAAGAAGCPAGLPSRKAPASPGPVGSAGRKPTPTGSGSGQATASAAPTASPSPSAAPAGPDGGHPVLDGITDFWEDIGELIGLGGRKETPAPTATPPAATSAPAAPAPSTGRSIPPSAPHSRGSVPPSAAHSRGSVPPSAGAKAEEIPCLGARQMNVRAEDGGLPRAAARPGVVRVASLTMYESSYDGVAEVPTGNGPVRSLKFTMDRVVNKPFSLTIDEPGGGTVIESGELVLDGNVEFYSPTFRGRLFGLIPVTFTPDQPPPLTLPVLWFTDVTLDLAYVRSDVLTARPLDITAERA